MANRDLLQAAGSWSADACCAVHGNGCYDNDDQPCSGNGCDYCASAHTVMGKGAGVAEVELALNLKAESTDARTQAALTFAKKVVEARGRVSDADVATLREAGYDDGEIVEIVMHIGLNLFTNYFNHIVDTEIDFPVVKAAPAVQAA